MTTSVRRASAFAAIGALALVAPIVGKVVGVGIRPEAAAIPFVLVAIAAIAITDGPLFDLFARPTDHEAGKLRGLFGFAASGAILGGVAAFTSFPTSMFVGTVLFVATGNLCSEICLNRELGSHHGWFVGGGAFGLAGGFAFVSVFHGEPVFEVGTLIAFVTIGSLTGGLVRSMLFPRDDPPVMFSVALSVWLLVESISSLTVADALFAVAVTGAVGLISYLLGTASVEGMIAGILLGLVAFVLGGPEWFLLLLAFFAIGGLSTKFQYDEKVTRGIAEDDEGARGGENVLANSTAAMVAVIGFATATTPSVEAMFALAYAGALATALGDTLSSEIGGVYDNPRLITTFERVPAGTDGAITWQGELAGIGGATIISVLTVLLFELEPELGLIVVGAGIAGMTVDSLLGAAVEGRYLGNEGVNFLATSTGGVVGGIVTIVLGITLL